MKYIYTILLFLLIGCSNNSTPQSNSGVSMVRAQVQTQADGLTVEQANILHRVETDNKPGAIKHLYVISSMSGQVIIYSTIQGKVTSSSKRLTPYEVDNGDFGGMQVSIAGSEFRTKEVLQDDGTYGSSIPYIFWWDVRGQYHQHYVSGGQIIHISDKPMAVKNITINMELDK